MSERLPRFELVAQCCTCGERCVFSIEDRDEMRDVATELLRLKNVKPPYFQHEYNAQWDAAWERLRRQEYTCLISREGAQWSFWQTHYKLWPLSPTDVCEGSMIRMNVAYWCRVTRMLRDAHDIQPDTPFADAYQKLFVVMGALFVNHGDQALVKLIVSQGPALALGTVVGEVIKDKDRIKPIQADEVAKIRKAIVDYEVILEAELQGIDSYYVRQQGAFSTKTLLERAEASIALPQEALLQLTAEMVADIREAGRCLVFELATACGFHIARATEAVINSLMAAAKCTPIKTSQRNWGSYIKSLQDAGMDQKITHHLEQVKDLHRNPLIHPEETLTMPEALALWSVSVSLIGTMLLEINKRQNPPQTTP